MQATMTDCRRSSDNPLRRAKYSPPGETLKITDNGKAVAAVRGLPPGTPPDEFARIWASARLNRQVAEEAATALEEMDARDALSA